MASKPPADPFDPHAMFGQLRALIESLRMEVHDRMSELEDHVRSQPSTPQSAPGDHVASLILAGGMIETRIKAVEEASRAAIESAVAPLRTDDAAAKAMAEDTAITLKKLVTSVEELRKQVSKPRKRTGVVNTPEGPLSMTVTEH